MATSAKIILDKRNRTKNGHPFKIYISNRGKKYVSLYEYSDEEHWTGDNLKKSHPEYNRLNKFLLQREIDLIKEVEYCNTNSLDLQQSYDTIKNGLEDKETKIALLQRQIDELKGTTGNDAMLLEFFVTFIKEREMQKKDIEIFEQTKTQVENYLLGQDMPINDITYEFLTAFSNYKLSSGCEYGGLNTYLAKLKTVYLEAQKRESLNIKGSNPFKGVIKQTKTKEIVQATKEEIIAFRDFVPNKNTAPKQSYVMQRRVAVWMFQFYIGGHDFVDIALLEWKTNVRGNRVTFRRDKNRSHANGGPLVDNVLCKEAQEIIKKYCTPERDRVFSFIPHPSNKESYDYYRRNTNRALKKVSEQCKLVDTMRSKSTRYIFKTWADQMELDFRSIEQIQGRKIAGVSGRYGARLPNKIIDKVLKKVIAKLNP